MPKEEDPHEALGQAAVALGVGAVITGLIFHWDEINISNGFSDPDNLLSKIAISANAAEIMHTIETEILDHDVRKVKLLRLLLRFAPNLARRILKNS